MVRGQRGRNPTLDVDGAVGHQNVPGRRSAVGGRRCVDQSGSLTESCPNTSSSALASTQTTRRAVTTDVCMTQRFDRCPVAPPPPKKRLQNRILQSDLQLHHQHHGQGGGRMEVLLSVQSVQVVSKQDVQPVGACSFGLKRPGCGHVIAAASSSPLHVRLTVGTEP